MAWILHQWCYAWYPVWGCVLFSDAKLDKWAGWWQSHPFLVKFLINCPPNNFTIYHWALPESAIKWEIAKLEILICPLILYLVSEISLLYSPWYLVLWSSIHIRWQNTRVTSSLCQISEELVSLPVSVSSFQWVSFSLSLFIEVHYEFIAFHIFHVF